MTNYSEDQIKRLAQIGSAWVSPDGSKQRIYFNHLEEKMRKAFDVKISYYNSGNVSHATENGEKISNSEARRILQSVPEKLWFDHADQQFYWRNGSRETALAIIDIIKDEMNNEAVQA